ncbi:MAG: 5'/3'-nucleotidase SurE, partial [Planctomycetota bacterium]
PVHGVGGHRGAAVERGVDIIYSGTVGAAIEAAFLGVPSIAVSLLLRKGRPRFDIAADHARRAIERLLADGLPPAHTCLNINIPATEAPSDTDTLDMPEIVVCPMNTHGLVDAYEKRTSPAGATYYWPAGNGLDFHALDEGTDVEQLFAGKITVTPLSYDVTRDDQLDWLQSRLLD